MREFGSDGVRKDHPFEQARQKVDLSDKNQIVDRSGIGDDQPHNLEAELFESAALLFETFECVFLVHSVRL